MPRPDWQEDVNDWDIPVDLSAYEKLPDFLKAGQRVSWWFTEDVAYAEHIGTRVEDDPPYSGIVVPRPDHELRGGDLEPEDCVVVMDLYPTEKCYPEATYMSVRRMLANPDLVLIVVQS